MLPGLSGALLSHYFAEHLLAIMFQGELGETEASSGHRRFAAWWREASATLGPASSARTIWDRAAAPLVELLGFDPPRGSRIGPRVTLAGGVWTDDLDRLWRHSVRAAIDADAPWCLCTNGRALRLVDARRTYSRAYLQFDLEHTIGDPRAFAVLWGVLRAAAFAPDTTSEVPLVSRIIQASATHGAAVSRALRLGVIDAVSQLLAGLLGSGPKHRRDVPQHTLAAGFDESLTLVYRVLFLMFAEARGLVPNWHPIYRDHYTIESLREAVERPGAVRGLWETLQAIARLAHQGCHAGTLIVPAFNGRLFSPARSPMADACAMNDDFARRALLAISITRVNRVSGRTRIDYRDLGVEQLGAVYESVLEYEPALVTAGPKGPAPHSPIQLRRGGGRRKATGSFYTPQSITDYLVRRTLHPLVAGASAEQILNLRIVDPAMGSAAFLVAACRYLAGAYERALVREGVCHPDEVTDARRATFRRQVAQRCLYGVDSNPTAVQLARLSLWLATLSAEKPLTFLDHRLAVGDSLIGASLVDLTRQPPPRRGAGHVRPRDTPLFTDLDLEPSLAPILRERRWFADTPDDRVETVREKESRFETLAGSRQWKILADLWCACWMWPDRETAPDPAMFASLSDFAAGRPSTMPRSLAERLLATARSIAETRRFFHWTLEFPEVYFTDAGRPRETPGFDAVIGNPPWDMLRAESGDTRDDVRRELDLTTRFVRDSGIYRSQGRGHLNRYQLFVERAMTLVRKGGRIGLVLPSGIATDHTSAPLRRRLLEHHAIDALIGVDNRQAIFPIHRSVRFVLCTATSGPPAQQIKCRFGVQDPCVLDTVPDDGGTGDSYPIVLTPSFIARLSGDELTIPELRSAIDLRIVERIAHRCPRLGDAAPWGARFGRELNATDDRRHFGQRHYGVPVLEGKHIEPFRVHVERSVNRISEAAAIARLGSAGSFKRRRLAYRDVASATNRVSLIAAMLPAGTVTTHSLFCLKTFLPGREQDYLCGMLNSYVANYLVRHVMTTHLGSTTVEALRVPKPAGDAPRFDEMVELARSLARQESAGEMARLQAIAAALYALTLEEFRHVLSTFPLVPESERAAALEEFRSM